MILKLRFLFVLCPYALLSTLSLSQSLPSKIYQAPPEVIEKIKAEGMGENSQVMKILSYLTNVIGGRLTNSPNMKHANEWTRDTMAKWGMKNAHLEAWGPFGRGWSLKEFSAQVVEPQTLPIIAFPKAWSPGTKGPIIGKVVHLKGGTEAALEKYKGKLKSAIVLTSNLRKLSPDFEGIARRFTDKQLLEWANTPDPSTLTREKPSDKRIRDFVKLRSLNVKILNFLLKEGAAVMVDNSRKGYGGTVFVSGASVAGKVPASIRDIFGDTALKPYEKESESKMIPQMTISTEHYNQLVRMIDHGVDVKMKVNIQIQYHDDDPMGYNTIAEIPGTDPKLKNEIVMMGAHLDSWHASGGATDNGAGSAVVMEAARIIMALGLKPRRTIRVALWSGEEQVLKGSEAYVKKHFGEMKDGGGILSSLLGLPKGTLVKKPAYEKFSAYYNVDKGTGKFRGIYLQENPIVAPIFKAWLLPFNKMGASTVTIKNIGGTDHLSFDAIGLPGFQFIQDPIEYSTLTNHSNQDNFDRIQAEDVKHNATIMAAFVYQTAMMDGKIPRKPKP